jgi:hypothetical protein
MSRRQHGVIPNARIFTSGRSDLACDKSLAMEREIVAREVRDKEEKKII